MVCREDWTNKTITQVQQRPRVPTQHKGPCSVLRLVRRIRARNAVAQWAQICVTAMLYQTLGTNPYQFRLLVICHCIIHLWWCSQVHSPCLLVQAVTRTILLYQPSICRSHGIKTYGFWFCSSLNHSVDHVGFNHQPLSIGFRRSICFQLIPDDQPCD